MSKKTSLVVLTEALAQHGWTFETKEVSVLVPDYDSDRVVRSRYSGRARFVPNKQVPGVEVSASNSVETGSEIGSAKSFRARFTADGKYLADQTAGNYPFAKGYALKDILQKVEVYSPTRLAEREAKNKTEEARRDAEEQAAVLAAYTEAKESLVAARAEVISTLEAEGLSSEQAVKVLEMVEEAKFGPFLSALTAVERIGKGWLPGQSYVSGTYENGVKVSS